MQSKILTLTDSRGVLVLTTPYCFKSAKPHVPSQYYRVHRCMTYYSINVHHVLGNGQQWLRIVFARLEIAHASERSESSNE